ncbi:MAG TPA: bifunctional phosphoribosyl-AMP cyclohydrolase/phosphoribosyl-ATP diphosphatase HisIE [Longimicrobiaceae bacterium]|jgi:phosphoribosyl-ATP pyrophosphohydrolase/phosphoribosyl-AMP cyclohydrolase|nr:bifunctional phosphoribosyl-AMP cyclohydrolase/phosphoribosyl-ATP diphosphatase HisIE [Longimicrobiaceae bacterium]
MGWLDDLKFDSEGLLPAVAQEATTGEVLMLAYANRRAVEATLATGRAHYWSRSRQALWMKGESSGHVQEVEEVRVDCDGDALLYRVRQSGPACHTLEPTCFFRRVVDDHLEAAAPAGHILARLESIIRERDESRPEGSYTTYLLEKGIDKTLKKVGEEATEVVIAAKNGATSEIRAEAADLLFHLLVLLRQSGLPAAEVWDELDSRFGGRSRIPPDRASHPHS